GTNRTPSNSEILANYYHRIFQEKGADSRILPLTNLPPSLIATDLYGKRSAAFQPIQDQVTATEKFLFIIPEYNASFPAILKLFVVASPCPAGFVGSPPSPLPAPPRRPGAAR